jgi:hypothetical protein
MILRSLLHWLSDHAPTWCVCCRYLMFAKNAHYERKTTGEVVPLCGKCHDELYTPFGR